MSRGGSRPLSFVAGVGFVVLFCSVLFCSDLLYFVSSRFASLRCKATIADAQSLQLETVSLCFCPAPPAVGATMPVRATPKGAAPLSSPTLSRGVLVPSPLQFIEWILLNPPSLSLFINENLLDDMFLQARDAHTHLERHISSRQPPRPLQALFTSALLLNDFQLDSLRIRLSQNQKSCSCDLHADSSDIFCTSLWKPSSGPSSQLPVFDRYPDDLGKIAHPTREDLSPRQPACIECSATYPAGLSCTDGARRAPVHGEHQ